MAVYVLVEINSTASFLGNLCKTVFSRSQQQSKSGNFSTSCSGMHLLQLIFSVLFQMLCVAYMYIRDH